jgi:hypothetical protein
LPPDDFDREVQASAFGGIGFTGCGKIQIVVIPSGARNPERTQNTWEVEGFF